MLELALVSSCFDALALQMVAANDLLVVEHAHGTFDALVLGNHFLNPHLVWLSVALLPLPSI